MKTIAVLWLAGERLGWRLSRKFAAALLAAVLLPCFSGQGAAATGVTLFHTFSQSEFAPPSAVVNPDGATPMAKMTLGTDGNLYGTTLAGGANGAGIVFSLSTGGTLTDLYDFPAVIGGGATNYDLGPNALVEGSHGHFYGTTGSGGNNLTGSIFLFSPSVGQLVDLYDFSAQGTNYPPSNPDGANPSGALVLGTDGNYYGTTQTGGSNGNGTIFQLTPSGGFTSVYSFSALSGVNVSANTDGATPNGLTLGPDGNFYGTTGAGGANGMGMFFQYTIAGVLTPLYSFGATASDSSYPNAPLVLGPNGNFYGTSSFGGSAFSGTIFAITTAGVETVLHSFSNQEDPNTALTPGSDGNFYGTTGGGGANGQGTLFQITPAGALTSLFSFAAVNANGGNAIGAQPDAALAMGADGNLYGSCTAGGAQGNGTIFRYANAFFVSPTQPPLIVTQPVAKSGLAGTVVTLGMAAKGAPTLTYQWVKNSTNILANGGDISGATNNSLTVGPLQPADAGSYSVLVSNNFGHTNTATVVLKVVADVTPPTVKILSPVALARTNAPVFSGTAFDNVRVTNVVWWLTNKNGGSLLSGTALLTQGGSNWSFAVTPFPGTNILAVQSADFSGLVSKTASQTFFYKVTNALTLLAAGDGIGSFSGPAASVKNDTLPGDGAVLNIGEQYSIKAVTGKNSLFSNWVGSLATGGFTNTGAALSFVMQSNLVLTANFVSNFFLPAHGTYNGLFSDPNAVAAQSSGLISGLALATNGTFSAKLWKAGTPYAFSGAFDVSGHASNNVGPATAPGGVLKVHLYLDPAGTVITGTVSNTLWTAELTAEQAGSNLPSAEYTLLFAPPAGAGTNTPPGNGYAQMTNHLGTLIWSGSLADGAAFTVESVAEAQNGDVPFYATPYGDTGLLLGWINLTNLQAAPPSNTLTWIKARARTYPPYTNGITNVLTVQGSLWTNPPAKTPTIDLPDGQLVISNAAGLLLNFNVGVSNNNALVKLPGITNSLTGSIAPKTGLFTVTFGDGKGKATLTGTGAILQNQTNGGGFFPGTTNAGFISLWPPQ